ncbi:sco-spondin [Plakobranchus ocellatus]|uniref:Sco-spondin n=1 Tax=Plakobranchus ocellatus TaxID=259542 RepID=A0AAV3ZRW2_9GAST|nr:sco-spondin [Plakobranchus ocellatus]
MTIAFLSLPLLLQLVDGVWQQWSAWDMCSVTCGGGYQARNRTCDGPYYQGLDCQGLAEENQTCNTQPCPIDGFYGAWSAWSQCSVSCGGGTQSRDRPCTPPQHQGQDCQGPSNQTQDCNTQPCPVDGFYLDWSEWSECPVSCGGGVQWRNRTCEPPRHGGAECQGPDNVTRACNAQPCPIDGVWLPWTEWSVCTTTCGGGEQERTRLCQQPKHGGQPCLGPERENLTCAENPCPIPGDWFPWSNWTRCTVTCGGGTKYRERVCDTQSYGNLTAPCEGPANETVACHTFDCLPLARTCSELGLRGLSESTIADIDLDGPGITTLEPVQVYCDMVAEDGVGVTVVGHDQEERQRVQGWEGAREYEVILHYNISFDHVEDLVDQSGDCKQYISWECFAALIHNPNDNFKVSTGWLNRTGQIADYFGGASPGSRSCACGMNNTCAEEELKCNCDANDEVWRQDDGYITYKDDLPVYAFVAGDTGGRQEDGYHHLGPLFCHGRDNRVLKKKSHK